MKSSIFKIVSITVMILIIVIISLLKLVDKPVKVAILDTGINSTSIESRVISKKFVKDSQKGNNHGSDIARIIESQNNTLIYDAKVLNNDGLGTVENTIAGIDWAIKNKVNVINMSYGFTHDYQNLHKKIKEANNKGIIILAANGNDIFGQKEYPASYKETISIGVMKSENNKSIFNSNNNADLYIPLSNKPERKVNNTSEATALATNRLIKKYKNDFRNMSKNELISVIKKE